jgi:hypothetical protein
MSDKHQTQPKALDPEPARQTAVTETAQLAPKIWSAALGSVELVAHGVTASDTHVVKFV